MTISIGNPLYSLYQNSALKGVSKTTSDTSVETNVQNSSVLSDKPAAISQTGEGSEDSLKFLEYQGTVAKATINKGANNGQNKVYTINSKKSSQTITINGKKLK